MNVTAIIKQLRSELNLIDQAIVALQSLVPRDQGNTSGPSQWSGGPVDTGQQLVKLN